MFKAAALIPFLLDGAVRGQILRNIHRLAVGPQVFQIVIDVYKRQLYGTAFFRFIVPARP